MRNMVLATANQRLQQEAAQEGETAGAGGGGKREARWRRTVQRRLDKAEAEAARLRAERDVLLGDQVCGRVWMG